MSGVDPLAAAAAGNADLAALVDAELAQLAADAQALRALLVEDAVLTARVLPSNGLTDLLEIAGRRVAASLPPTVRPGDVLQVRVTGFDGDRTLLQIVATGADAAVEPGPPNAPLAPQPGAFVAATIQRAPGGAPVVPGSGPVQLPPFAAQAAAFGDTTTVGGTTIIGGAPGAPPEDAAADPDLPPPAVPVARPGGGSGLGSVASRANVTTVQAGETVAGAVPGAALRSAAVPGEPTSIEARLAAARAADSPAVPGARVPPAAPNAGTGLRGFVAPPAIESKSLAAAASSAPAAAPGGGVTAAQTVAAQTAAARASALAAYAEPVALLRTLRLPVTPSNVSSAALALQRPERLPDALAALERALPRASDDPNVATLRTLLAFVGRIDPRSPVLAAQIAAYVEHVVDGAEPKLATLLAASQAANVASGSSSDQPGASPATGAHDASAQPASSQPASAPDVQRPIAAGVAAERGAALSADLKQTMLAVAANPATPESAAPSLAAAITALTAVQLSAAQTLAAQPDGLAFTIPLATAHGTANAQITVKRDAPQPKGGARLDPANFRVAFVLETAHYGTVAIDLVTVGRDVTVDVRTEAAPAMRAFRNALGGLTARLESLRYRVASAGASVGTTSTVALDAPPSRPADPDATVDRSA
jgi:hypothetical protein